jgi:DHA3 family tetracycline resistance protein-like MFS transporter
MNNRRSYRVFLLIQGADKLFFSLITTVNLVYQAEVAHLSPLQLVLVGTVLEISCFLAQIPTGVFADAVSRRWSVIIGFLLVGCGFILEGTIPLFATILLAQIIWGIGATFIDGALEAWIADEVGEEHVGDVFIRANQLGSIINVIGVIASVAIASFQVNLSIICGGALYLGLSVFLIFAMPERWRPAKRAAATQNALSNGWNEFRATVVEGTRLVRGSQILLVICAIGFFFGASSEGLDRLWIPHLLHNIHLPALWTLSPIVWLAILSVGSMPLSLLANEIMRRKVDTNNRKAIVRALLLFNTVRVISILFFALVGNFWVAVLAIWSMNLMRSLGGTIYRAWLVKNIDPRVRATVLSFNSQVDAAGQFIGGPLVGWLGNFSLQASLAASGAILAMVLPLLAWSGRMRALASDMPATPEDEAPPDGMEVEVVS